MQATIIVEDPALARAKYAEYMRAVKERHSQEYVTLKNAYRELSKGRRILDLQDTLRKGGVDSQGLPRLAICRADAKACYFWYSGRHPIFSDREYVGTSRPAKDRYIKLPEDHFGIGREAMNRVLFRQRAFLPSIPPRFKPVDNQLSKYHVLWEAEWKPVAPVDPILLRRVSDNLFVVIAQWDLTPLERAVLAESFVQR